MDLSLDSKIYFPSNALLQAAHQPPPRCKQEAGEIVRFFSPGG